MELSHIRLYLSATAKLAVVTTASAGLGYAYGKMFKADATLAAKAWAITNLAQGILLVVTDALFRDRGGLRNRMAKTFVGVIGNVATILSFRHLNLIATNGTIFYSINAVLLAALQVRSMLARNHSRESQA